MSEITTIKDDTVHESCLAGLELMLQHGLLSLENPYTHPSNHEFMLHQQGHLGLLPTATTTNAESKLDEASPLPHLISSWHGQPQPTVQLDDDGYVVFLDLGGKRLHRGFPCSISATMGAFSRLETLNLAGTDLPWNNHLAEILQLPNIQQNLKCLYLGGNGLGDEGATAMATEFLACAKNLNKLDLRFNDIGGAGMKALCQHMPETVQHLYLEGNQVGTEGAVALGELLKKQSSQDSSGQLREVFLGANQIDAAGAKALAQSLHDNQRLSKLYLEGNNIGLEGANAFSSVLEELAGNTALKNLYVDNNDVGKEGSKRLAKALNSGTAIGDPII
jgi:Leucine Rich repeat